MMLSRISSLKCSLIALLITLLSGPALAQNVVSPCVSIPGFPFASCRPVAAANPLPVSLYASSGGVAGYCLISNGPGTQATFQVCGGGGGITSVPLGAGLTITKGTNNATPLIAGSSLFLQTYPIYLTSGTTVVAGQASALVTYNSTSPGTFALPQAGTTGFEAGVVYNFNNMNTGNLTISTTTSLFNGVPLTSSNIVLGQFGFASCTSDGINWDCEGFPASTLTSGSFVPTSSTIPTDGLYLPATNTSGIADNSHPVLETIGVASAVDFLTITNAATASPATLAIAAAGTDSNIGIALNPKGTGNVTVNQPTGVTVGINITSANTVSAGFQVVNTSTGGISIGFGSTGSGVTAGYGYMYDNTNNGYMFASKKNIFNLHSASTFGFTSSTDPTGTVDTTLARNAAGVLSVGSSGGGTSGKVKASGYMSVGTKFTATGCSNGTTVGGASAGKYSSGTTGTCTVVVTMGDSATAPNGWACFASDLTTPADLITQTASSTTTATLSGTTISADVISFGCIGY